MTPIMRAHEFITENSWREAYSTPYAVFGLPVGAPLEAVERAYKRAMAAHHPDRMVDATPEQLLDANRITAYLNTARAAIKSRQHSAARRVERPPQPPLHPDLERAMHPPMPTRDELRRDREQRRRGEELVRKVGDEIRARRQREFNFAND